MFAVDLRSLRSISHKIIATFAAVIAAPLGLTRAGLGFQIKGTVTRAVGQALQRLLVHGGTVRALPALLADAGSISAVSVAGARGMWAVN